MYAMLGFTHFIEHTDGVARVILCLLLSGSIISWYLIITKGVHIFRTHRQSRRFLDIFWNAPDLETVAIEIRTTGTPEPFSYLLHHGFTAVDHLSRRHEASSLIDAGSPSEMLTRALRRAIEESKARLEFGQTFLATVASSAPFVGLLGTVWGIYHALITIGATGQGTLDKVAGPVGEALIMTGIGLAVAIPASIAYNSIARTARNTLTQLNLFAYDVHNFLATGIKASPLHDNARTTSDKVIALAYAQQSLAAKQGGVL